MVRISGELAQAIEREADNIPQQIGFKRLSENAVLPTKANPTDSGLDLYASADVIIAPGETVVIPTDLAVELPQGYEAQVRPRSGITSKTKLRVQLGTIDNEYKGNIGVIVDNIAPIQLYFNETYRTLGLEFSRVINTLDGTTKLSPWEDEPRESYLIRKGDKIAQLVVQPIPQTVAVEIAELSETDRGTNGWGSSGV